MNKIALLLFYLVAAIGFAQQGIISGKVLEESTGEALLGATVQNLTTNRATTTDFDGLFSIEAAPGDVLKVSFIGTVAQQITITDNSTLTIILKEDVAALEEVVVIGYGTQAVKEVTGAVSVVKAETIEALKPTRVEDALQGTVPGLPLPLTRVLQELGSNIRIQGYRNKRR